MTEQAKLIEAILAATPDRYTATLKAAKATDATPPPAWVRHARPRQSFTLAPGPWNATRGADASGVCSHRSCGRNGPPLSRTCAPEEPV